VTDEMFLTGARALAAEVSEADLARGSLYPPLRRIRAISASVAVAVARLAYERNLATEPRPDDLAAFITSQMYEPSYESYV
jgi:malate dehydrogenase (oxaloacetate-decarboxylating)(NADP+)